jgi:AcrR family transcriptional regulator
VTQLRSDAQRNLGRLLTAAAEAFAERGADVSVDEIARRAGVGHGTVFRRFPTKDALIGAVVLERVLELRAVAEAALADEDPAAGFHDFMLRAAEIHARDRRLLECFDRCLESPEVLELHSLGAQIIERAQAVGAVRLDLTPVDVETIFKATLSAAPPDQWQLYAEIVLAGLRPPA